VGGGGATVGLVGVPELGVLEDAGPVTENVEEKMVVGLVIILLLLAEVE